MSHRFVVFGSGRQGVALAYDLAKNADAEAIDLADADADSAHAAVARLQALLADRRAAFHAVPCDVANPQQVAHALRNADVAISAVPYRYNLALTDACIAARVSLCDLGGNTDIVRKQLARDHAAANADVSIVPDCGLAPGLGNILAAFGVEQLDQPLAAHIRCGGLPDRPVGPLGYKLVFNFDGLINEYSGVGEFLRDGRRVDIPALTELESINFDKPLGTCEAAVTSGGTSTCAETFLGKLQHYDYKTVRYPGHFAIIRALFALGCFNERVEFPDGTTAAPKQLLARLFANTLDHPNVRDLVVLRVTVSGQHAGTNRELRYELLDRHDEHTGFTAMERTTAFPTALGAQLIAEGRAARGAQPPERALPLAEYVRRLPDHDIRISDHAA